MLQKFSVSNFRNFETTLTLDLHSGRYDFNEACSKNKIVNTAIIYGYNASGKSNLALALFDIVATLTDNFVPFEMYPSYQHVKHQNEPAQFSYDFLFSSSTLSYRYSKSALDTVLHEEVLIDDVSVLTFDREKGFLELSLPGTESLEKQLTNPKLSAVKYVKANAQFAVADPLGKVFLEFIDFVDRMLLFWCLQNRKYMGYQSGITKIMEDLITHDHLDGYNTFLKRLDLDKVVVAKKDPEGKMVPYYDFGDGQYLPFLENQSNGENALLLFYYWIEKLKEKRVPSLICIDEFDAFYHIGVAKSLVQEFVMAADCQVILTSHNPSLISNDILRPDCYFLLQNGIVDSFKNLTEKDIREAHNIERMFRAGAFTHE